MSTLINKTIQTPCGDKQIRVCVQDITALREPLDIMTVSGFYRNYVPVPRTLMGALERCGISVEALAQSPAIDLRATNNIWLSNAVENAALPIGRIGCIEMTPCGYGRTSAWHYQEQIIRSIQAYFHLLHIASLSGIPTKTVGIPILGGGNQQIDAGLTALPTINECLRFLQSNEAAREIRVISRNEEQAAQFADALEKSYAAQQTVQETAKEERLLFISYSSIDRNIADNLCAKLEAAGVRVWYAPRNVRQGDYASEIATAITRCTDFVVVISKNSLQSHHVLNEVDLAVQELNRHIRIMPLRIDEEEMGPAFRYYLSRQHWMDAHVPPLEKRLEEFVDRVCRKV